MTDQTKTPRRFQRIDASEPLHAAAYLKAASHFLSSWPSEWDAETLALALVDEESPNQVEVRLWNPMKVMAACEDSDPHLFTDEQIVNLAEDFLSFLEENS